MSSALLLNGLECRILQLRFGHWTNWLANGFEMNWYMVMWLTACLRMPAGSVFVASIQIWMNDYCDAVGSTVHKLGFVAIAGLFQYRWEVWCRSVMSLQRHTVTQKCDAAHLASCTPCALCLKLCMCVVHSCAEQVPVSCIGSHASVCNCRHCIDPPCCWCL